MPKKNDANTELTPEVALRRHFTYKMVRARRRYSGGKLSNVIYAIKLEAREAGVQM